jgi:DegV family protein with EDD domain
MKYKIIADSCCDLTAEMKSELNVSLVPLHLMLEDKEFIDDENLSILEYIEEMKKAPTAPRTACPSPEDFIKHFAGDEDNIFIVTLSQELSGTYNSAKVARDIYLENHDKNIYVFNSRSASVGETLIALKIAELAEAGKDFQEIIIEVERYIDSMETLFLLQSLSHLAKAGRLKSYVAVLASLLAIKPIMGSTKAGTIRLVHKVRGYKKAFLKLIDTIGEEVKDFKDRILGIAHCNCYERAMDLKEKIAVKYNFKKIFIVPMSGLSSTYADDGGIVIAF